MVATFLPGDNFNNITLLSCYPVVLLAEDRKLHSHLKAMNIKTDTIHHAEHNHHCPVRVLPARYLGRVYKKLGICEKVSLTGRPHRKLGVIATSQLYSYYYHSRQMMVAFTPSVS
jgi:phosphorylase kinase alpha/beta subunit